MSDTFTVIGIILGVVVFYLVGSAVYGAALGIIRATAEHVVVHNARRDHRDGYRHPIRVLRDCDCQMCTDEALRREQYRIANEHHRNEDR